MAFCIFSKRGWHRNISPPTHTARTGSTTHTMRARRTLRVKARISAATTMVSARTIIRRNMAAVVWRLVMSFVRRVMREAEENRSMSAKEKVEILSNWARRRLAPIPWEEKAAALAAKVPHKSAAAASSTIRAPEVRITRMSILGTPTSMMRAICSGMSSSHTVSSMTRMGAITAYLW